MEFVSNVYQVNGGKVIQCNIRDITKRKQAELRCAQSPRRYTPRGYRLRHKDGSCRFIESISSNHLADPAIGGIVFNYRDITKRKQAEGKLKESRQRLQVLSRRLVEVQETERRHLARELHDEIGQALTVAELNLQAMLQIAGHRRPGAALEREPRGGRARAGTSA